MEARHRLSALGGARVLGVRRGSLPVLSSRFVDSGRRARGGSALEDGAGRVLLDCAHARRSLHVPAGPRVAPRPGRAVCGRVLRAESLPLVDRLLAKRLRRTTGLGPSATCSALSTADLFAGTRAWLSPGAWVDPHARRRLADERTRGRHNSLLGCWTGAGFGGARAVMGATMASAVADSASHRPWRRLGVVLFDSHRLRNALGQYRRGAVAGGPSAGQFSFHHHRRSRSQPFQLFGFDRGARGNRPPRRSNVGFPPLVDETRRDSRPRRGPQTARFSRAGVVRLSGRAQRDGAGNRVDAAFRLGHRQRGPDVFGEQFALAALAQVPLRATSLPLAALPERRFGHASHYGRQRLALAWTGVCSSTGRGYRRRLSDPAAMVGHSPRYPRDERRPRRRLRLRRHRRIRPGRSRRLRVGQKSASRQRRHGSLGSEPSVSVGAHRKTLYGPRCDTAKSDRARFQLPGVGSRGERQAHQNTNHRCDSPDRYSAGCRRQRCAYLFPPDKRSRNRKRRLLDQPRTADCRMDHGAAKSEARTTGVIPRVPRCTLWLSALCLTTGYTEAHGEKPL